MNHEQKEHLIMRLLFSPAQPIQATSLSSYTKFLNQYVSRRRFMKAFVGLAIICVESELASCSSQNSSIPSLSTGVQLLSYIGHNDFVFAVAWSPDGQFIVSGGQDKTVQVWNAVSGILQSTYQH